MVTLPMTFRDPFCVAFRIFVAGDHNDFTFGVWAEHRKFQLDDKLSLKWAWSRHMI